MSQILASVYDYIEETGKKEGSLFLDEINCVSETLAPAMLQFLQYKTFGKHEVPEGWIIATAGNPKLWFETLTKDQQLGIATKCQEFVTLQQEMTEWRKSLTQEETERLKEHMHTLSNQDNIRKVKIMQHLMNIARRVQQ